jgi:hypothetical protein
MLQAVLYIVIAGRVPWHSKASLIVVPKTGYPCLRLLAPACPLLTEHGCRGGRAAEGADANWQTPGKSKAEFGERDPGESGTNEGQHQTGALGRITRLDSALRACLGLAAWLETRVVLRPGRPGPPQL